MRQFLVVAALVVTTGDASACFIHRWRQRQQPVCVVQCPQQCSPPVIILPLAEEEAPLIVVPPAEDLLPTPPPQGGNVPTLGYIDLVGPTGHDTSFLATNLTPPGGTFIDLPGGGGAGGGWFSNYNPIDNPFGVPPGGPGPGGPGDTPTFGPPTAQPVSEPDTLTLISAGLLTLWIVRKFKFVL